MVKGKVLLVAGAVFAIFTILMWITPSIIPGFAAEGPLKAWGFYLVLAFAILVAISAFLPYNWGKIFREVAYVVLFILVLLVIISLVQPFAKKIEVEISDCENFFFPKEIKPTIVYSIIDYISCVLAGFYPRESPETANVAWTTFYIFYLILPFAFIVTIVYGVMKAVGIDVMFGTFGGTASKILTIVIALYAARLLAGKVLLEFLGYGAWAFGGLFGAIFIV